MFLKFFSRQTLCYVPGVNANKTAGAPHREVSVKSL
jgi:hypothetical protein